MEATAVEVGLTLGEYYSLTPIRFFNIRDRVRDKEIREARRIGQIPQLLANVYFRGDEHPDPFMLDEFAPRLRSQVAESGPRPVPFEGPEFLRPCAECRTPKWQGHLPGCKAGQRQFQTLLDKTARATERLHEEVANAGKAFLVPRR